MKLIALTGGIAAGKSTIARRFEELGAWHIDADQLAREAVEPASAGYQAIRAEFGDGVLAADGTLDRAALAAIVFGSPERLTALNNIVHPEVRRLLLERLNRIERDDPHAVVIYDVPLLVEAQHDDELHWNLVLVAHAPADVRVQRMIELRGMTREEAESRIANQSADEERLAIADHVIETGGDEQHTIDQVDALWRDISSSQSDS